MQALNSNESRIRIINNQIHLINDESNHSNAIALSSLMQSDYNVFFTNHAFELTHMNESTAKSCGFDSPRHGHGKTVFELVDKVTATHVTHQNTRAMHAKSSILDEYDWRRNDGVINQFLTLRVPCFQHGKLLGLAGFGISIGEHPLVQALQELADYGFTFHQAKSNHTPVITTDIHLSSREKQCLSLLTQGKTAKLIADSLGLSTRTVEHYLDNIKAKLKVKSKPELIERALSLLQIQQ